jgi:hypothetical protein
VTDDRAPQEPDSGSWWKHPKAQPGRVPPEIDTTTAHSARIYDYMLGGKDNFAPDRAAAEAMVAAYPAIGVAMRENRGFLRRVVRFLAAEAGIRQFLDIGTGIPTSPNVHEIAQGIAPESRVVYVDNDPIVLAHARALLASSSEGVTAYIDADLLDPDKILNDAALTRTLDLSQPTALTIIGTLHFFPDSDDPHGIIARLASALPPDSYIALQHGTKDFMTPDVSGAFSAAVNDSGVPFVYRTRDEFARFFDGLDLVPPGITPIADWRAEDEPLPRPAPERASSYGAVGRKPAAA